MNEEFALEVVIDTIKKAKNNAVILEDDLQFKMAITVIDSSKNKKKLIKQIKDTMKKELN